MDSKKRTSILMAAQWVEAKEKNPGLLFTREVRITPLRKNGKVDRRYKSKVVGPAIISINKREERLNGPEYCN